MVFGLESPEQLKNLLLGHTPKDSDSVNLVCSPRIHISDKLLGAADAMGPKSCSLGRTHL